MILRCFKDFLCAKFRWKMLKPDRFSLNILTIGALLDYFRHFLLCFLMNMNDRHYDLALDER